MEIDSSQIDAGQSGRLSEWQVAMIDVFVRTAGLIGLPRSIGEIYGLLYCARQPLSFDDLELGLGISRGSVSQGLKVLRQIGAVEVTYVPGSRKDHYKPELSMVRLIKGFIRDQFTPHLDSGQQRMAQIEVMIESESDPEVSAHARARLETLKTWQARTRRLFPIVVAVLGGTRQLMGDAPSDAKPREVV